MKRKHTALPLKQLIRVGLKDLLRCSIRDGFRLNVKEDRTAIHWSMSVQKSFLDTSKATNEETGRHVKEMDVFKGLTEKG